MSDSGEIFYTIIIIYIIIIICLFIYFFLGCVVYFCGEILG